MQITESELSSSIENNDSVNPESNNSSDKSDSNQNIPETSDFSNWFTFKKHS